MRKSKDYNTINWSEHFYLDETSPSGLSRKKGVYAGKSHAQLKYGANEPVGNKHYIRGKPSGWDLELHGQQYKVHRVIWVLLHGSIDPLLVVDHLDGNPLNNLTNNLKIKTYRENSQNVCRDKMSVSGATGVSLDTKYDKNGTPFIYWKAQWSSMEKKNMSKHFSIAKHGYETAKQLAIEHRNLQINLLNAAGASYTERHTGLTPGTPPAISPVQPT